MRNALAGLTLAFSVPDIAITNFFNFESKDPYIIDSENPGLLADILDEVALRAGFAWREKFHVFDGPPEGFTYTEALANLVEQVDVVAEYWIHLQERLEIGITFPEGFWDTSLILVGQDESGTEAIDLLSWSRPFTNPVWGLICIALIFTTAAFWVLEKSEPDSDFDPCASKKEQLGVSLFLAGASFTGGGGYTPQSFAGRLFTISWTFCCLLLTAAYTANLASFLVVTNMPQFRVNSIMDAAALGVPVCVFQGTAEETLAREAYPSINWVPMPNEVAMFAAVESGRCVVAVSAVDSWTTWKGDAEVNGNCSLRWIGRIFRPSMAGVALKSDAGVLCTSLVRDVLDLHFKDMKADGALQQLKERYFGSIKEVHCTNEGEVESQSQRLGVEAMGGTFLFHAVVGLVALVVRGVHIYLGRRERVPKGEACGCPQGEGAVVEARFEIHSEEHSVAGSHADGEEGGKPLHEKALGPRGSLRRRELQGKRGSGNGGGAREGDGGVWLVLEELRSMRREMEEQGRALQAQVAAADVRWEEKLREQQAAMERVLERVQEVEQGAYALTPQSQQTAPSMPPSGQGAARAEARTPKYTAV